ncbi:MAG: methyltransferase domain-containing protein [Candidatus Omnitrophota bacterium]
MVNFIRRNKYLKIVKNMLENAVCAFKIKAGLYRHEFGSTHKDFSVAESLAYIDAVFEDYLRYGGISAEKLSGKTVLEIGPGDNLGVALKFIAYGAARVVCVDRIYSARDRKKEFAVYSALRESLGGAEMKSRFDSALELDKGECIFNDNKLVYIYGLDIGERGAALKEDSFDLIISRAVLEHIYNIDSAFDFMDRHLKRGGCHLHKVDLRDHDMFTRDGHNPLTFLTIPEFFWSLMTRYSGKPNRRRADYFEKKLSGFGYDYDISITSKEDMSSIDAVRPKLAAEFKGLPDENLLVGGIFIAARKK